MDTLVDAKVRVPRLPEPSIDWPRLHEALGALVDERGLVLVVGPAGSGKTTAVTQFAHAAGPVAWLTLDVRDRSPRRFVEYLARSLRAHAPQLEPLTAGNLAGGSHPRTARDCSRAACRPARGSSSTTSTTSRRASRRASRSEPSSVRSIRPSARCSSRAGSP